MNSFRRFAFLTTLATYFLIFAGGLVRVSGAGLGCPDWPRCFGRWIPPVDVSQIPAGIDVAHFNFTLAWIEYFNRLGGVVLGLLVIVTAILALRHFRHNARVLYPTLAAAFFVAVQGWLGSVVVASSLEPVIVTIHMVLALVIVSLLLFATQESYRRPMESDERPFYPSRVRIMVGFLWLISIFQVILGTQVREALEHTAAAFPLWSTARWMAQIGLIDDIHLMLGLALAFMTAYTGYAVLKLSERPTVLVRHSVWGLMIIVLAQAASGVALLVTHLEPLLDIFHLWLAALYVGLSLVLYVAVRERSEQTVTQQRQFSRVLAGASLAVVLMGTLAFGVVDQADRSRDRIPEFGRVPDFTFTERFGQPFGSDSLQGKISVVDFIFTRCHSACPTMCAEMRSLYDLYQHSDLVQFVSIDVDPDYDSLPVMREYLEMYGVTDNRWNFLRGPIEDVRRLAEEGFSVSSDFPGMHSTRFILVDPSGRIRGYYEHSDASAMDRLKEDIKTLARKMQ
jgi:cytochrome c oxidase assembly protein subunit 15